MHEIDLAMRGVLTAALHDGLSRYAVMRLDAIRRCAERLAAQGIEPTIEAVQADFIRSGKKAPKAGRIWFALNGGPVDVAPEMVEPEAEAAIDTAREIAELRAAIDELPAQECDVMRMRLTGATQAEVATELRINVADVRRLEASASARLRHELG
jgi:RNA polymerase sigma factor (sigma-70 family)